MKHASVRQKNQKPLSSIAQRLRKSVFAFYDLPLPAADQPSESPAKPQQDENYGDLLRELQSVHPSWIEPILRRLPIFFLPALTPLFSASQQESLKLYPCPQEVQLFFPIWVDFFLKELGADSFEVLLEPTPLDFLLGEDSVFFEKMLILLGLTQISPEIRQIVDKNILLSLLGALNEQEQCFLRQLLQRGTSNATAITHLRSWDRTTSGFKKILEKIGFKIFLEVLADLPPYFLWRYAHRLPMHKGVPISSDLRTPQPSNSKNKNLFFEVINYLKSSNKK